VICSEYALPPSAPSRQRALPIHVLAIVAIPGDGAAARIAVPGVMTVVVPCVIGIDAAGCDPDGLALI
jgi:hypothetical protein